MLIKPYNTADSTTNIRKTLLYAHHGWGKTTQAKYFQKFYGPGFILSGEAGLASVKGAGIDYLPFHSWDGEGGKKHDPAGGVFSFKGLLRDLVSKPEFRTKYKWVMLDSFTELSDMSMNFIEENPPKNSKGEINGFEVWSEHASNLIGAAKYVRDLPMHVIVTALAKEEIDENGVVNHWPMVKGKQVQKQMPGIFDCVMCGVRVMQADGTIKRYVVNDEYKGWHGKVRDEHRRLLPVEEEHDLTKLFQKMDQPPRTELEELDAMAKPVIAVATS